MALADTAKLAVDLSLKGNFASQLGKSQKALTGFDKAIDRTSSRATRAGQQVGVGIQRSAVLVAGGIGFLVSQVGFGLRSLATLEKAGAQTNAVIASTGGVAGITAAKVRDLAEAYEAVNATIDDKVIQSGQNLLLTFTNIRKEAFEPALRTALDLNTRLGGGEGGLQNTIKLLGKALNDPLKGLGALSKAGITFNKQQTDQIKALVKNNDLLGAQELILAELGKRYGGAFAAEGKTAEGTIAGIGDAVEDLQKALATGLFPVISKLLPKIRSALGDPKVLATVQKLGDSIAGLFTDANIAEGGRILGNVFETAKAAAPVVGEAAKATLGAVRAAVSLFTSLPKEVQQLAIGAFAINKITGGLVTNLAGGLISSVLKQLVSGVVNVSGAVVNVVGGPGLPGGPTGGNSTLKTIATGAAVVVTPIAAAVGAQAVLNATIPDMGVAQSNLERATARAEAERAAAANGTTAAVKELTSAITAGPKLGPPTTPQNAGGSRGTRESFDSRGPSLAAFNKGFANMVAAIKGAKNDTALAAALKTAIATVLTGQKGNVKNTQLTLDGLRSALKNTNDPKLQAALKDAIGKVERKVTGRKEIAAQLAAADRIWKGTGTTAQKIAGLERIQSALGNRSVKATQAVRDKLESVRTAARDAGRHVRRSIDSKNWKPTVNVKVAGPNISIRTFNSTKATSVRYGIS